MQKFTADSPETQSADLVAGNIEQFKALFPEVFSEDKVDFEVLKQLLGGAVDDREEKYGLNWHGKRRARQLALTPSTGTLRPCPEESVDWDTTQNLMIEGDNLEVLKLLQKSYAGKVKMIYIDPPYNTGNDFIYPDDFRDNIKNYLELTGQVEGGQKISSNTESSGRFHTDWLNMMYPRLKLARNLLRNDGVIFISIDDKEQANLKRLCDEIFGEENYINTICVKAKPSAGASGGGEDKRLKKNAEFLLLYVKNINEESLDLNKAFDETDLFKHIDSMRQDGKSWKYTRFVKSFGNKKYLTSTIDGDGNEIKIYEHSDYQFMSLSEAAKDDISEIDFYLKHFDTVFRDTNAQSSIRTRVMDAVGENDGLFSIEYIPRSGKSKGIATVVYYKGTNKDQLAWLKDIARCDNNSIYIKGKTGTLWLDFNWNNVSKEGNTIFPNGKKPIAFIQRMLSISTKPDEKNIVLDFFSGSGSTAHAVMQINAEDHGNRKFIMVQLPEPCDPKSEACKAGFSTIAEISKERIRRAGQKIKTDNVLIVPNLDTGFRVFKLDSSNIHAWEPNRDDLADTLLQHAEHLKTDRTEQDILFELLLKLGLDLTVPIEQKIISGKTVHSIGAGVLLTCLAPQISNDEVESLALGIVEWHKHTLPAGETQVVFRDSAFADDVGKTNLTAILQQHGLTNVRSL